MRKSFVHYKHVNVYEHPRFIAYKCRNSGVLPLGDKQELWWLLLF